MSRKITKIIVATMLVITLFSNVVYAKGNTWRGITFTDNDPESVLLASTEKHSRDVEYNGAKGSLISTAIADITNAGGGDINILIETLAHVPCDQIRHQAILERWDEEHEDWATLEEFTFVETKEDHPDGDLSALTSTVTVTDQPAGYYYRVRGYHMVKLGKNAQGFSTRTDGVLITKD